MADGEKKKKKGPKLEFLLNNGDYGSFGFGSKGDPFVPRLYVRYLDESGNQMPVSAGRKGKKERKFIDENGLGTVLSGMDEIGSFLYETLPFLVSRGALPEDIEKSTVVKLIGDEDREKVRTLYSNALDELRRMVPMGFGNKSAAVNKALVGANTASDTDDEKAATEETEEDEPLTNFDIMKGLRKKWKDFIESPDIAAALQTLNDNGYVLHRELRDDGTVASRWFRDGVEIPLDDIVHGTTGTNFLGLSGKVLDALEWAIKNRNDLDELAETEKAERAIEKKLREAIESGDFNELFGPRVPNYRTSVPKTVEDDAGNSVYIPILVDGGDYTPEAITYPRYGIDLFDLSSPFYKGKFGENLILDDYTEDDARRKGRKKEVDDKAKEYRDNAYKFSRGTGKYRKLKNGNESEIKQTFRGISPKDALAMPRAYLHKIFDYIGESKGKAFPGFLEAGGKELMDMYDSYMLDKELTDKDKQAFKKAHEDSLRKFDVKASQPGGKVSVILDKDSEGNVKGVKQLTDKELFKMYKNLLRNMLKNDGKFNNLDRYIGKYGKKIIENPELEEILRTEPAIKDMAYDGFRNNDPRSSLADTIMESGVNVLKRRLGL